MTRRGFVQLALVALVGCRRAPAPPPPKVEAEATGPAPDVAAPRGNEQLERIAEYMKEHPWGDNTGAAAIRGSVRWSDGAESPKPLARHQVTLKGVKGTPRQGVSYNVRTNEQGEFQVERMLGGEYELTDGQHWRLRVRVDDGQQLAMELTPDNSVKVRDDFPPEAN
jgi:hypothetical protein